MGRRGRTIDADVCAALYAKLGTVERVTAYLPTKGVVNPKTGKPYSLFAIYMAIKDHPLYLSKQAEVNPNFAVLRKELGLSKK